MESWSREDIRTLKQTISGELLDCGGDPSGLKEVFDRYGRSKSPFYAALSVATIKLAKMFLEARRNVFETESQVQGFQKKLISLEKGYLELEKEVDLLDQAGKLTF